MAYSESTRYKSAVQQFLQEASQDPQLVDEVPQAKATIDLHYSNGPGSDKKQGEDGDKVPYSLVYHVTLVRYINKLCPTSSEGMSLAGYCQHIRRWNIPRSSYPEGLSGYKSWRIQLNKFHTTTGQDILESCGYSRTEDSEIFTTIANLLQKKGLKGGNDKGDEEMQIFEDAICLTFLELEFAEFAKKHDEDKMVKIVQKTWGKMGHRGRDYAMNNLASGLPEDAKDILGKALSG